VALCQWMTGAQCFSNHSVVFNSQTPITQRYNTITQTNENLVCATNVGLINKEPHYVELVHGFLFSLYILPAVQNHSDKITVPTETTQ
jgi:hypothetical protein